MRWQSIWQDQVRPFLLFSRGERRGILLLCTVIVLAWCLPRWLPPKPRPLAAAEWVLIDSARHRYARDSQARVSRYRITEKGRFPNDRPHEKPPLASRLYRPFDPNQADAATWLAMGVSARTAATIQRYLAAGGRFRQPEDLRRIYGLREQDYLAIRSWVRIGPDSNGRAAGGARAWNAAAPGLDAVAGSPLDKSATDPGREGIPPGGAVSSGRFTRGAPGQGAGVRVQDINRMDSADWERLPGIGPVLAQRIVRFREGLGGFGAVEQLAEVYGIRDSLFQALKPRLSVAPGFQPPGLSLNGASQELMEKHPYLGRRLARLIVAYRQQHGPFTNVEDLLAIPLVDTALLKKLRPYLRLN